MCNLRDVVIFLAGAAFLHTISHIVLPYFITMPLDMGFMVLTTQFNFWVIGISAIITIALLWWACKLNKK
ncbi:MULTISPECIES: hypothetical protein [unclassified Legionella]|uniref:hypothetical protein n=1 Tax=Legionella sp. PC997 TaxID=2755562 RepID=UPI0015F94C1C|nr:hypothetical protein [Legionella sp. PC997]QMT61649.1 hypothetical protein HBNCFIEN_03053 [Legionella sp. PC997]